MGFNSGFKGLVAEDSASYSHAVNICRPSVMGRWFFKSEILFGLNMLCFKKNPEENFEQKVLSPLQWYKENMSALLPLI